LRHLTRKCRYDGSCCVASASSDSITLFCMHTNTHNRTSPCNLTCKCHPDELLLRGLLASWRRSHALLSLSAFSSLILRTEADDVNRCQSFMYKREKTHTHTHTHTCSRSVQTQTHRSTYNLIILLEPHTKVLTHKHTHTHARTHFVITTAVSINLSSPSVTPRLCSILASFGSYSCPFPCCCCMLRSSRSGTRHSCNTHSLLLLLLLLPFP
jgi:hypothetical protein